MAIKQVLTPDGLFESAAAVAEHYGITLRGARKRIRRPGTDWRYVVGGTAQEKPPYRRNLRSRVPADDPLREQILKYRGQMSNAARRGIPFEMTFEEWWAWWQEDNRWARRGRGRNQLVMARIEDKGSYRIGNVYCATGAENSSDKSKTSRNGPVPKRVWTEDGVFPDVLTVARRYGLRRGTVQARVTSQTHPWHYVDP